ncbi:UNVERIFIED_CONTAM: hypothetical protein GTU68_008598, partial [Idotea baltica]|nr:hypothetical protein [Idotea baltica]
VFSQFPLHTRLLENLRELDFKAPTSVQEQAIPHALQGEDLRLIAQTGTGKTTVFLLPIINKLLQQNETQLCIKALILLPTRELAQQTLDTLKSFTQKTNIRSGIVTGGEDFKRQAAMMRRIDILVATPGRLIEHLNNKQQLLAVLHGEKDQKDRKRAIEKLKLGSVNILVATDLAARGLDVKDLDLVINFNMPRSGDEYLHRIGRSGRAEKKGLAISLIDHTEWSLMSSIERYLKQRFEHRVINSLKGSYTGPKKLKASGKAASTKKRTNGKTTKKKKTSPFKKSSSTKLVSSDGLAPLKRKTE